MLHYRKEIERMIKMYATMEEYQALEKAFNVRSQKAYDKLMLELSKLGS